MTDARRQPPHGGHGTDSAGQPWAGRTFDAHPSAFAADDGAAPELLITALTRFRELADAVPHTSAPPANGTARAGGAAATAAALHEAHAAVVDAVRDARLLVPLIARAGETGVDDHGRTVDKTQELSLVTVRAPDGRTALPAFTSTEAMSRWNPDARPIPTPARRVALAAAGEGTDLVVLDPTSPTEFAIRRPALWAIAEAQPWMTALADEAVHEAFAVSAGGERSISRLQLFGGDPHARLAGTEVVVVLTLASGLDRVALDALVGRLQQRWAESDVIGRAVDSISVRLVAGA
ncbi:SseB family protein [Subtercola boreus]|uniref:SseB protein N-terminal domain-containing protein n=1 Tax=Subtercola boreus TaxID=120213 RepID=A0A3E0WEF1_9MICO|nr:SseB family protein [Subtercola boreus]RFA21840.1 hypothetical protein B7R24_06045 [Subtercola boreus]RFA21951.1 hypothetical protein B7R23_05990 [Subtercola boreus]RFA27899.1 hypothetical protein B7R25_06115 [Subtercola boreus]